MAHRIMWLNPESIRALNTIDIVFDKRGDQRVRDAWAAVLTHAYTPRPADAQGGPAWDARLYDLRVDLYQRLGAAVGYDHTVDYIKTRSYTPLAYGEMELEQMQIRKGLVKLITEDGLKVVVRNQQ
jgi:hypothetical protein